MADYTMSIREVLHEEAIKQNKSLLNMDDVGELSQLILFGDYSNLISEQYRNQFVTGFAYKFMNEEIGLETFPLWRMSLAAKLFNNASYINMIYDNLDKQIFADYTVHISNRTSNGSDVATGGSTDTVTGKDMNVQTIDTGGVSSIVGHDVTLNTGEDTTTENAVNSNTQTTTGNDKVTRTGTDTTVGTTSDNSTTSLNTNDETQQTFSDTPQNGLSDVMNGTYLTNALINKNKNDHDTVVDANGSSNNTITHNTTDKSEVDSVTTGDASVNSTHKSQLNTKHENDSTSSQTTANTGTVENELTRNVSNETINNSTLVKENEEEVTDTSHRLSMEMLLRAQPLLNKVWDIFEDIFIGLY